MIHVTSYKRNNTEKGREEEVIILLDPSTGFFYNKLIHGNEEEITKMPHASMFVYPHVPRTEAMQTEEARRITNAAKQWLSNKLTRRGHHE